MSYRHILVAVDFDKDNRDVINKAVNLAKPLNAKLSLIHVNQAIGNIGFTGLIDVDLSGLSPSVTEVEELREKLGEIADSIGYDVERKFVVNGDISTSFEKPVKDFNVDLIVCGHHHDFWSRLSPSVGGLINTSPVDILIVTLKS